MKLSVLVQEEEEGESWLDLGQLGSTVSTYLNKQIRTLKSNCFYYTPVKWCISAGTVLNTWKSPIPHSFVWQNPPAIPTCLLRKPGHGPIASMRLTRLAVGTLQRSRSTRVYYILEINRTLPGEMAQWIKHMPHMHELEFGYPEPIQKAGWEWWLCDIPAIRRWRQGIPGAS